MDVQTNIKQISKLKDILLRIHHGEPNETIQEDLEQHIDLMDPVEILPIVYELKNGDDGITTRDVKRFLNILTDIPEYSFDTVDSGSDRPAHPLQILEAENEALQSLLSRLHNIFSSWEENEKGKATDLENLKEQINRLGQFYNHYNRKEKIIFPILERYGHYTLPRIMWADDDRIRNFYKGTKTMVGKLPELAFRYVKKSYDILESKMKEMIADEEMFLIPILAATFNEDDWLAVAEESEAFGYTLVEPETGWVPERKTFGHTPSASDLTSQHVPLGGGYLTIHEANHILNNLPIEITFVDKNGIFKYFNTIAEASDMMFIRTPSSIGRNVANCHPPKSMKKVMRLIRDLKTKRRESETMWFKKKDKYIHITYKGIFDENDEFLGILEYVQDIQPFFELPREVKKEVSVIDEP